MLCPISPVKRAPLDTVVELSEYLVQTAQVRGLAEVLSVGVRAMSDHMLAARVAAVLLMLVLINMAVSLLQMWQGMCQGHR